MARIPSPSPSRGGLALPFTCDHFLIPQFNTTSSSSRPTSIILQSPTSTRCTWRRRRRMIAFAAAATKKKKQPEESSTSLSYTEEAERFEEELRDELLEEAAQDFLDSTDSHSHTDSDEFSSFRGLVLDLSYRPVNIVCWKRAICLEFMDKADVLEYYDQTVSSATGSFYIPAVLRIPTLLQVAKRRRVKQAVSRKNVLFRDSYTCQYCSTHQNLTIDHVIPTSRGGQWTWENLVAACERCNSRKGQKSLEEANMKLLKTPKAPKEYDIVAIPLTLPAIKMLRSRKGIPDEWADYLGKPKYTF